MNPEKNLVVVRGKVDPDSLVNLVARTGKQAEIVCWNKKQPSHAKCCNNPLQSYTQYSCCHDHNKSYKIQEEEQHKCEDYVPPLPSFDEGMCRDYFYKPHSWRPATQFSSFFGHIPHHAGGPFRHDPRWFVAEPPPPPPPPPGLGRRHSPGFYDYGYFH